jgi:hypothetical protein
MLAVTSAAAITTSFDYVKLLIIAVNLYRFAVCSSTFGGASTMYRANRFARQLSRRSGTDVWRKVGAFCASSLYLCCTARWPGGAGTIAGTKVQSSRARLAWFAWSLLPPIFSFVILTHVNSLGQTIYALHRRVWYNAGAPSLLLQPVHYQTALFEYHHHPRSWRFGLNTTGYRARAALYKAMFWPG